MWTLEQLQYPAAHKEIGGKWVPARPENYKPEWLTLTERVRRAWAVFTGKADAFTWPEGQ